MTARTIQWIPDGDTSADYPVAAIVGPPGPSVSAGGAVIGPASAVDGHVALFDGTTGKLVKDGGVLPTVPGVVSAFTNDAGYITGNQAITLSGDVTGSGATAITGTIAAGAVSLAKLANLAANSLIGNNTGVSATPLALTGAQVKTLLAIGAADVSGLAAIATSGSASNLTAGTVPAAQMPALTGDVTSSVGSVSTTITTGAVTLAKMADMATASLIYRKTAGSGAPEVQTLATLKTDLGLTGTNSGDQTITLSGDATGSGTGAVAVTLADIGVTAGSYTAANITVDAKGRVTAAANGDADMFVRLNADYTLTSTTSAQQMFDTTANGRLTLAAGLYEFDGMFVVASMSATSGNASVSLLGAGTAVLDGQIGHASGADNNNPIAATAQGGTFISLSNAFPAVMVPAATGTGMVAAIKGMFVVTTAGTLIPSITLLTAAAAVMKRGSFFRVRRIADAATYTQGSWD